MLQLFNTLTRTKEVFTPLTEGKVLFYHCGPTVYWTQHIGNMRGMLMADLIRRSLEYLGYNINFVRNYTDVGHLVSDEDEGEDKMEKGAKREGLTPDQIADKYIKIFEEDTKALNIKEPTNKPRATECIKEMISMVQALKEKGYAYETKQAVYFDVTKFPDYNKLNKQKLEENQEGAGTGEVSDPEKKHSYDFALWIFKTGAHKNALQTWESPFYSPEVENGEGFPGWHIECSAMSKKYLGDTIDIHMGGIEHISVHHTNEIAQSEAANGKPFVHYWLHNEHLNVNGGKMSKSEGTGYSLQEVKEKGFNPLDLRYFFLNAHYRSKQNFTWEALEGAQSAVGKLTDRLKDYREYHIGELLGEYKTEFTKALEDDFNIPGAIAVFWELIKSDIEISDKLATMINFDKVLGLGIAKEYVRFQQEKIPEHVAVVVEAYTFARKAENYEYSDELRAEIEAKGYQIKDTKEGTKVYKI